MEVERRARRFTALLDAAGVGYAIVGGVAASAWVCTVDEAGFRGSNDVDVLLRRADLSKVIATVEPAGFLFRESPSPLFLDGPEGRAKEAVKVVFAGERLREADLAPSPELTESVRGRDFSLLSVEALVRMMLVSNRNEDGMLLRDLLDVGLFDYSWLPRYTPELADRLKNVLDTPNG
jgi:hypothetical protein